MEIKKNVPIPPANRSAGRTLKYPLDKLDIGDCLEFTVKRDFERCRVAATHYGKRHAKRFITRLEGEVFRMWRVN